MFEYGLSYLFNQGFGMIGLKDRSGESSRCLRSLILPIGAGRHIPYLLGGALRFADILPFRHDESIASPYAGQLLVVVSKEPGVKSVVAGPEVGRDNAGWVLYQEGRPGPCAGEVAGVEKKKAVAELRDALFWNPAIEVAVVLRPAAGHVRADGKGGNENYL